MSNSETLAQQNDAFRSVLGAHGGGKIVMTRGIQSLEPKARQAIFTMVKTFNTFSEENDPYGEHDFGSFSYEGEKIYWKIDYYDSTLERGSEDPADPEQTVRVLTVMLSHEY